MMPFEPGSLEEGLPSRFDLSRHKYIQNVVKAKKESYPKSWEQFLPVWRAVPLRLLWSKEHSDAFTESIRRAGSAPSWPDRYIQDQRAFSFFVSGLSAVEVTCYGIYAVASIASPPHFPILLRQDLRRINPKFTNERLKEAFPDDLLAKTVQAVVTDPLYQEWKRIRNSLIHHCAPSRIINASIGVRTEDDDSWSHPEFIVTLNELTTHERYEWLLSCLNELEEALATFISKLLA